MSGRELGSGGDALFDRVAEIIESARSRVARTVNTAMVHTYWLVGREIVEVEQAGETRGGYGDALIAGLAARLTERFGRGFTSSNLERMRRFYRAFPSGSRLELRPSEIGAAVRHQSMSLEIGASAGHSSTLPWFSFVLVHLKFGKLTHQDLGQMQMYAHFFDRFQRVDGEGPTIGIACTGAAISSTCPPRLSFATSSSVSVRRRCEFSRCPTEKVASQHARGSPSELDGAVREGAVGEMSARGVELSPQAQVTLQ